jgi:iron complex transport system permease protein
MTRVSARAPLSRVVVVSTFVLVLLILASLAIGAGDVTPGRALSLLLGADDAEAWFVVGGLRWPRTLLAICVGAGLGVAGVVLQTATRNPLAEPGLLGVSAGASFAVVLAIQFGASAATVGPWVAVAGAFLGCMLVLATTRIGGVGQDPVRLVLAGAAFSGILTSISTLILLRDQRSADEIRFWIIGALGGRPPESLVWGLAGLVLGLLVLLPAIRPLAALMLGEQVARGLGHHPQWTRQLALVSVAILVGTATAVAGPIAFIGLVVPFVARRVVGPDLRRALTASLLLGPCVVLLADVVSRLAVRPYELPVGVVTAFIGAPVLIAVVRGHNLARL